MGSRWDWARVISVVKSPVLGLGGKATEGNQDCNGTTTTQNDVSCQVCLLQTSMNWVSYIKKAKVLNQKAISYG